MQSAARPMPPAEMLEPLAASAFTAAPDLVQWARATFIDEEAVLYNEVHRHLQFATLGALWTNVANSRQQRTVVGQCEIPIQGARGKWARAREEVQLIEWFGDVPDFVLTFDARFWAEADDATCCAVMEHELAHAGQDRDAYGLPKFRKSGEPAFALRGHDVEAFVFIAARYGAVEANVQELVDAVNAGPLLKADLVGCVCGTCGAIAA